MFQRMIDDFKASTGVALRQTTLVAFAAIALFITTSFLCAALFIVVLDRYGPVAACLSGAALFFVVTLISALSYWLRKREIERRAAERAKSAAQSAAHGLFADPMMLATGLQLVRTLG